MFEHVLTFVALLAAVSAKSVFIDSTYNPDSLVTTSSGTCYKASCDDEGASTCFARDSSTGTIKLSPNACQSDTVCSIKVSDFSAVCTAEDFFVSQQKLFPGYSCDEFDQTKQCSYAKQKCVNNVCQGMKLGEPCGSTADCEPHLYCEHGKCSDIILLGSDCSYNNQCGRRAMCLFKNPSSLYGKCTALFSLDNNSPTIVDVKSPNGFPIARDPFANLVCKSGYADENGICTDGIKSKYKGQICYTDSECSTDDPSISAPCKCGFNGDGTKYCDIMPGDTEWVTARAKFKEYWDATVECNIAARWEDCDQKEKYYAWKCAEAKAKYYVYTLNMTGLSCATDSSLSSQLPIFSEIKFWCEGASASKIQTYFTLMISIILLVFLSGL